jgi:hypothetical protein
MYPAWVLEGFSFTDILGEGRGKSGENYPKTPSSRYIAVRLVKGVLNKVGMNERTLITIVFID